MNFKEFILWILGGLWILILWGMLLMTIISVTNIHAQRDILISTSNMMDIYEYFKEAPIPAPLEKEDYGQI